MFSPKRVSNLGRLTVQRKVATSHQQAGQIMQGTGDQYINKRAANYDLVYVSNRFFFYDANILRKVATSHQQAEQMMHGTGDQSINKKATNDDLAHVS